MESKQEEKFVLKQAEEDLKKKHDKEQQKQEGEGKKTETKKEKPAEAKKPEGKKEEKEKKREIVLERLYTIPLKRALHKKARMARHQGHSRVVRSFAAKHLKTGEKNVKIDAKVAVALTKTGRNKMLGMLKVKISKDKEGTVLVELAA